MKKKVHPKTAAVKEDFNCEDAVIRLAHMVELNMDVTAKLVTLVSRIGHRVRELESKDASSVKILSVPVEMDTEAREVLKGLFESGRTPRKYKQELFEKKDLKAHALPIKAKPKKPLKKEVTEGLKGDDEVRWVWKFSKESWKRAASCYAGGFDDLFRTEDEAEIDAKVDANGRPYKVARVTREFWEKLTEKKGKKV